MLSKIAPGQSDELLLGFETSDDAAVYRLTDDMAAVLTLDFFTPIVDDPYDFGRITAANALSDVYAMGGTPLAALNLLAFPCALGPDIVGQVVRGGADKVREAGAITVGGHTIEDSEPKYGLAVFGTVHPEKVVRNRGCVPGDVLFLTKPIGTGVIATALKRDLVSADEAREVIESMAELNAAGCSAMLAAGAHAATDVTGYGLAGHLHEMLEASGCSAEISWDALPRFDRAFELAAAGCKPGRAAAIVLWAEEFLDADRSNPKAHNDRMSLLCDPQTSGGLLVSIPAEKADEFAQRFFDTAGRPAARIGNVVEGEPGRIRVIEPLPVEAAGENARSAEAASATGASAMACGVPETMAFSAAGGTSSAGKDVFILGDTLGKGNDDLGRLLMTKFIYFMAREEKPPRSITLMNHGVRLSCEGSEVLEDLELLAEKGVVIRTCGTCLDFLGIAESLKVGGVGTMPPSVELLLGDDNVLVL